MKINYDVISHVHTFMKSLPDYPTHPDRQYLVPFLPSAPVAVNKRPPPNGQPYIYATVLWDWKQGCWVADIPDSLTSG